LQTIEHDADRPRRRSLGAIAPGDGDVAQQSANDTFVA
jgi:hypothetical protein